MAIVKCDHGHEARISTPEFLDQLTLDQKRYALKRLDEQIKKAEEAPKRTIWRVCTDGLCVGNYREEDYEKAAAHLVRIFEAHFVREAARFVAEPYGTLYFGRQVPRIEPERVTQFEYETEWFPPEG